MLFIDILLSIFVALLNIFICFLYSLFREKSSISGWAITFVNFILIPFFFFIFCFPMFLKSFLKNFWMYNEPIGFIATFFTYTIFVILNWRKIEEHWNRWKHK